MAAQTRGGSRSANTADSEKPVPPPTALLAILIALFRPDTKAILATAGTLDRRLVPPLSTASMCHEITFPVLITAIGTTISAAVLWFLR
jgi:hypothetical protein